MPAYPLEERLQVHYPDPSVALSIAGTEEEVLDTAVYHATTKHGHKDSPELREQLRSLLKDET